MRKILEDSSCVTQGTIFSNAKSNDFFADVYGILVNGRCDIEHPNHYYNYLYLPIVPYTDWESKYAIKKLLDRKYNDMIKILEGYKIFFSYKALLYLPEHIEETIEKKITKEKEKEKIRKALFFLRMFEKNKKEVVFSENEIRDFKFFFKSDVDAIRKELIDNKLPDSVYLENVDFQEQQKLEKKHYVVLLTEIYSIPNKIIKMLENGINLETQEDLKQFFGKDEVVIPCSILKSPYIEHLIHRMVDLFRVGIDRADDFIVETKEGTL